MRRDARRLRRVPADVLILALALALALPANALARRPIPDTSGAVHVWDDQLPDSMTDAQVRFVATHVDGTQKVSRQTAVRLRAAGNPGFLVLHYRLGIGDGPVPFRIGERWASDYASVRRHGSWFWHERGRRVFQRQWRWYLMNPSSGWRAYWARRVVHEAALLGDDGVFADSLSVPQYLGPEGFSPPLRFFVGEGAWTRRVNAFMRYEERRLRGRLWFIPNAGSWITTRDRTDYAIPDGVMIEGFAAPGDGAYAPGDWRLQMQRVVRLARRGRVVIGQSYPSAGDVRARLFDLASYLLTKGRHSFVNLLSGPAPQWFPEYGIDLGAPADPLALRAVGGIYVRRFARGVALVNPDDAAHAYALDGTARLVEPHGGGTLGTDADVSGMGLSTRPVSGTLTLPAHSGAILLR
jgi:Hypothetical glycosyl hydrolase family 15